MGKAASAGNSSGFYFSILDPTQWNKQAPVAVGAICLLEPASPCSVWSHQGKPLITFLSGEHGADWCTRFNSISWLEPSIVKLEKKILRETRLWLPFLASVGSHCAAPPLDAVLSDTATYFPLWSAKYPVHVSNLRSYHSAVLMIRKSHRNVAVNTAKRALERCPGYTVASLNLVPLRKKLVPCCSLCFPFPVPLHPTTAPKVLRSVYF